MAWWAYICFLDAGLALRNRTLSRAQQGFVFLVTMSAAFWCIFEAFNLRLENWFYINVPARRPSVSEAIFSPSARSFPPSTHQRADRRILPEVRIPSGILKLLPRLHPFRPCLPRVRPLFPVYCFALAWVFLIFIIDGYNYRKGYRSFARPRAGRLEAAPRSRPAGMICGFLWEFWNYWSITKWVYTVPFFEEVKIFEMPAPGYIGFALFGLGTIAFVNLLEESRFLEKPLWRAPFLALVFAVISFFLIERYTVFSHAAPIERLSFLTEDTRSALERKGVKTSYAIDPRLLNARERQSLALMHLKGLGIEHAEKLQEHGVATIGDLAKLDERQLSAIIGETQMRRVRVYLRAARVASS